MANTTQRIAQLIEEAASAYQGAGEVYLVCAPTNTWYPQLQANKGSAQEGGPPLIAGDLATALGYCVSGRGDLILVAPDAYSPSTEITVTIDDVTIVGLGGTPEATRITGPTTAGKSGLNVSGNNVTVKNIHFVGNNATGYGAKTSGRWTKFVGCRFGADDTAPTQLAGLYIDATAATAWLEALVDSCRFLQCVTGLLMTSGNGAAKVFSASRVTNSWFAGNTTADINTTGTTASAAVLIDGNTIAPAGGVALKFDTAFGGLLSQNWFSVAANTQANLTGGVALNAATGYVGNYTQAGLSVAKPT